MKHGLKALAAATTLALSAGYSEAATYNFNVSWNTIISGCTATNAAAVAGGARGCYGGGTTTGTWDNVTNVLNFTGTETMHIDFQDTNPITDAVVNRTFTIDTDALLYTYVNNSCSDNTGLACGSFAQGVDGVSRPLGDVIAMGTVAVPGTTVTQTAGFVWNGVGAIRTTQTSVQNRKFTFSNLTLVPDTPQVPVPAAAWLFGSGLLGLAGAARKRR